MSRLQHFLFLGFIAACLAYALATRRGPSAPAPAQPAPPAPAAVPAAVVLRQAAAEEAAAQARISELARLETEAKKRDGAASKTYETRHNLRMARRDAWNSVIATNWEVFHALRQQALASHKDTRCTLCDGAGTMHYCVLCPDKPGQCVTCEGTGKRFGGYCPTCQGKGKCYLCFGTGKMTCPFCDDGMIAWNGPLERPVMPINSQPPAQERARVMQASTEKPPAQVMNTVSQFIQGGTSLHQAIQDEQKQTAANLAQLDSRVRHDYFLLGFAVVLIGGLTSSVLVRHRREAEIRLLRGRYLADGTEAARFEMDSFYDLQSGHFEPHPDLAAPPDDAIEETAVPVNPLKGFFAGAPEQIGAMRQLLSDFGKAFDDAERHEALVKLHELVGALKGSTDCWDLKPVWQMSTALELLLKRLVEKGKEATPSTLRTVASAVDLLNDLCVPGVRPDLIINPPISVLAVDDDPLCLRALKFALEKAEMAPDLAEDGEKAVALAANRAYDVVFMDIQMPGIDGLEACSQIHKLKRNEETPVVFVTVRSDFQTRAQSTLKGGADLMAKPFLMFEIMVKALTLTMRKRLHLVASSNRAVNLFTPPARPARPAVPPQPAPVIPADKQTAKSTPGPDAGSEHKEKPMNATDSPAPTEDDAPAAEGADDSEKALPLNSRKMKRQRELAALHAARMKEETVSSKP